MENNTEFIKLFLNLGLNIVPCDPITKIPIGKWGRWQKEKYQETINQDTPICIICGEISNNLVVIDVDAPELINDIFTDFEGLKKNTLVVRTGGGGYHIYVRPDGLMPPTLRLTNKIGQHIDIQSQGTHIVAPPSIHKSGKQYEIISSSRDIMSTSIPKFLKKLEQFGFEGEQKRKAIHEILKGVGEGERNDSGFRTCMLARHLFKDVKATELLAILQYWNERNDPQMPTEELETIVSSAMSYTIEDAKKWIIAPNDGTFLLYGDKEYKESLNKKILASGKLREDILIYCLDCKEETKAYPYKKFHAGHRVRL